MSSPTSSNNDEQSNEFVIKVLTDKHQRQLRCVNRMCKDGDKLFNAMEAVCDYYHIDYKPNKEVCVTCLIKCLRHYKHLEKKWQSGKCVMDAYFPNFESYFVIDSSDEDDLEEKCELKPCTSNDCETNDEDFKTIKTSFDIALDLYLERNKLDIDKQITMCNEYLNKLIENCMHESNSMDDLANSLDNEINEIKHILYESYTPTVSYLEPLDISVSEEVVKKTVDKEEPTNKDDKADNQNIIDKEDKEDVIAIQQTVCSIPPDLPKLGTLEYPPFREGQLLYAKQFTLIEPWYKCKVKSVINEDYLHVKFKTVDKLVTTKEVAYATQNHVQFPVGTRVIAKFNEHGSKVTDLFYAGVIGEPPKLINEFRYMIFFDDGYVQYRSHKDIRLVVHKTNQVWNDVHPDSKEFIRVYLENYPERQMLKLSKNHFVRAEYQNKWQLAKVLKVDASIVKLFYTELKITEWLYRGSTRLWNIFEKQIKSQQGIRSRQSGLAYLNKPFVEYTSAEEPNSEEPTAAEPTTEEPTTEESKTEVRKNIARKSSSKGSVKIQNEKVKTDNNMNIAFKTENLILPKNIPRSKLYKKHKCNYSCVEWTKYKYNDTKSISMLATPLFYGFTRYSAYFNIPTTSKCIMYNTPCGRKIRTMKEMHDYLIITRSSMTIDQFDFNSWVRPLAEFTVLKYKNIITDISSNKEFKSISCVNVVNNNLPPPMVYMTSRQAMPGVFINLDKNYLCGCDCTDNCQDKSKCACWQMTIEGQKILPNLYKDPNIGYNYRRLPERVLTGIYECNKTCKCKSSCLNRVVQNPLSQRLQLFLTEKKGWGVRCLNDIPQGSFICIYVGYLLTEADANEGGKNYGDEYLAELDYIEVVEKIKEDYESDVDLSDQEDSDDLSKTKSESSDEDFQSKSEVDTNVASSNILMRLRKRKKPDEKKEIKTKKKDRRMHVPSKLNARDMKNNPVPPKSMREYFGNNESVYIMDAKTSGNIGRYLNHSCSPNTFVQNVFVDTHDLRFPWVSFFALHYIPAGTELTWDYSYDIGSVPGKVMKCHCESVHCRGRLL